MHTTRHSELGILRSIAHISQTMNSLCSTNTPSLSPRTIPNIPTPRLSLSLPIPDGITESLANIGCTPALAKSLSDTFIQSAYKIRAMYESIHHQSCQKMAQRLASDPDSLSSVERLGSSTIERQYQQQLRTVEQLAIKRGRQLQQKQSANPVRQKAVFNQEFVPLLEKYFEYNAYPSAPDRAALARKSMMTPRQIEVWFQNHRNRAKKEGKNLRRLTSDPLPLKLSLESLEQTMPFFVIPEKDRKDPFSETSPELDSSEDSDAEDQIPAMTQEPRVAFSHIAPPHAFPTPYTPSTGDGTFSATYIPWMRTAATTCHRRADINVNDLTAEFTAKLVIRDGPFKNPRRASPPPNMNTRRPWFWATHTMPSSAPHPALIRSSIAMTLISLPTIPTVAAPPYRLHPFRSPTPSSHPSVLVPTPSGSVPRRKVARLPKRIPTHPRTAHRGTSPVTFEASPSPSPRPLTPGSRVSSFSSDRSSLRRPSSSSSSSSTASSTLTTPVFSPTSLPGDAPSPVSISGIDFQNIDDLFGDSPNPMSPLDGLNLSSPSHTSFNVPTIPGKDIFKFGFEASTARLR